MHLNKTHPLTAHVHRKRKRPQRQRNCRLDSLENFTSTSNEQVLISGNAKRNYINPHKMNMKGFEITGILREQLPATFHNACECSDP